MASSSGTCTTYSLCENNVVWVHIQCESVFPMKPNFMHKSAGNINKCKIAASRLQRAHQRPACVIYTTCTSRRMFSNSIELLFSFTGIKHISSSSVSIEGSQKMLITLLQIHTCGFHKYWWFCIKKHGQKLNTISKATLKFPWLATPYIAVTSWWGLLTVE